MTGLGPTATRTLRVYLWIGAAIAVPVATSGQQIPVPTVGVAPMTQGVQGPPGVSPRGAFLRAVLLPGWGHAAIGSYTRGGFYFALETATAFTLLRTRARLFEVRDRAAFRESFVRASLADEGITDPDEIDARLGEDPQLQSFQDLVTSREGQHEDLVAFGIFLVLLTGADAYVSAHLARFPAPIEVQAGPAGDGRAELALRVMLPR